MAKKIPKDKQVEFLKFLADNFKEPEKTTFKDVQDFAKTKMLEKTYFKKNKTTQDSAMVEELLGMPYDPVSGYIKDRKKPSISIEQKSI